MLRDALFRLQCGDVSGVLPFAIRNENEYLNAEELAAIISNKSEVVIFDGKKIQYDDDECHPREFDKNVMPDKELLCVPKSDSVILRVGAWPTTSAGFLRSIVQQVWGELSESREFRTVGSLKA